MSASTYTVVGMTCNGCAQTVSAGVREVSGVTGVDVDLASRQLTVTGEAPLDDAALRGAIEAAGYEVQE